MLKEYDTHYDYADLLLAQVALVEVYKAETLSIVRMSDDKFTLEGFEESLDENIQAYLSLHPIDVTSPIENFLKDLRTVCLADDGQSEAVAQIRKKVVKRIQDEMDAMR